MKKTALLLAGLLVTTTVFGSGGGGGSGGDGGGSGGNNNDNYNYDLGRTTLSTKLTCETCPLADLELTKTTAAELLPKLKYKAELGKLLNFRERYAVKYFLKKRFNL